MNVTRPRVSEWHMHDALEALALAASDPNVFFEVTTSRCIACKQVIGAECAMIHHQEGSDRSGAYHMKCWIEAIS